MKSFRFVLRWSPKGELPPLLSPSWTPARVRNNSPGSLWKTSAFNFRIFETFWADHNFSKNQTPHKFAQNLKIPTPCAAKTRFGSHFGILFPAISDAFPRNSSFLKTCIFPRQGPNIKGPDASISTKNPSQNHVFSRYFPAPNFPGLLCCFFEKV